MGTGEISTEGKLMKMLGGGGGGGILQWTSIQTRESNNTPTCSQFMVCKLPTCRTCACIQFCVGHWYLLPSKLSGQPGKNTGTH